MNVRCDSAAVVTIVNRDTSRESEAMHLLRCLTFLSARFQFYLYTSYLSDVANTLADDLSHNKAVHFLSSHIQTNCFSTPIPEELLNILVISSLIGPHNFGPTYGPTFSTRISPNAHTYTSAKNRYVHTRLSNLSVISNPSK